MVWKSITGLRRWWWILINKCRKALIDIRDLEVNLNIFQIYDAGEDAVILNQLSLRVALLARLDMIDPFFENCC